MVSSSDRRQTDMDFREGKALHCVRYNHVFAGAIGLQFKTQRDSVQTFISSTPAVCLALYIHTQSELEIS